MLEVTESAAAEERFGAAKPLQTFPPSKMNNGHLDLSERSFSFNSKTLLNNIHRVVDKL